MIMTNTPKVKYDNKFNLTNLNHFNKIEMDIFMSILSYFSEKNIKKITYNFEEIKSRAKISKYDNERFREFIRTTRDKLMNTFFFYSDEHIEATGSLFTTFILPKDSTTLEITINENFYHFFRDIPTGISFTEFELVNFLTLSSKYSQTLFRFLLQNYKGYWTVDISEFREKLGFPKSYPVGVIIQRLQNICEDINRTAIIKELTFTTEQSQKRGRRIESITFQYKIIKENKALVTSNPINNTNRDSIIGHCPDCHEPLYKLTTKQNTIFYGHSKTSREKTGCSRTFNSIIEFTQPTKAINSSPTPSKDDNYNAVPMPDNLKEMFAQLTGRKLEDSDE